MYVCVPGGALPDTQRYLGDIMMLVSMMPIIWKKVLTRGENMDSSALC